MPPLPSPGKVVRIVMQFSDGSDTNILNRFYLSYTGSISATDAGSMGGQVNTSWNNHFASLSVANYALLATTVTDLQFSTGVEVTTTSTFIGTNAGTRLGSGTAMVIGGKPQRRFRGGHPRVYISGLPEGDLLTSNTWTTTAIGNFHSAWTTLLSDMTGSPPADAGSLAAVNVSYYQGFKVVTSPTTGRSRNVPTLRTGNPLVEGIPSWVVNPKVASQRRRNKQSV